MIVRGFTNVEGVAGRMVVAGEKVDMRFVIGEVVDDRMVFVGDKGLAIGEGVVMEYLVVGVEVVVDVVMEFLSDARAVSKFWYDVEAVMGFGYDVEGVVELGGCMNCLDHSENFEDLVTQEVQEV